MKVGLVTHSGRAEAIRAADAVTERLEARGVEVVAVTRADDDAPRDAPGTAVEETTGFADGLDLAISVGGDGTLLRAAHICRDGGVPILGLNVGRLGFLTEADPDDLDGVVTAVVERRLVVEERVTLELRLGDPSGPADAWALNEVSVEKTARQRVLLMSLHVGGTFFARLPADAIVVASPTGSTAYSLSAGGPILSPTVRATIVTPVAAHSVFARPIVVAEDEEVRVEVHDDQEPAVVSCDGRSPRTVPAGGSVYVRGGGRPVLLARTGAGDFYGRVRMKFGLR